MVDSVINTNRNANSNIIANVPVNVQILPRMPQSMRPPKYIGPREPILQK